MKVFNLVRWNKLAGLISFTIVKVVAADISPTPKKYMTHPPSLRGRGGRYNLLCNKAKKVK